MAAGNVAKKLQISKSLDDKDYLHERQNGNQRTVNYVRRLGRGKYYALKLSEFGVESASYAESD